jgi:hypothetical protein
MMTFLVYIEYQDFTRIQIEEIILQVLIPFEDNQSIVQWEVVPLETKSTTLYDSGFSMIAMIPKFKLTV